MGRKQASEQTKRLACNGQYYVPVAIELVRVSMDHDAA
jgi:hypothetical protein